MIGPCPGAVNKGGPAHPNALVSSLGDPPPEQVARLTGVPDPRAVLSPDAVAGGGQTGGRAVDDLHHARPSDGGWKDYAS
jgi:hypothetical protein